MKPETANNPAAGVPQRRVGTVTMGVTMIVAGVGMLCRLMGWIQPETLLNLCRFAPLLLVGTGIELCIFGAAGEKVRLKYDFLSLIYCSMLLCLCIGMTALVLLAEKGVLEKLF